VIEDDFIVASVKSPLISLGRLLHRRWSLAPNEHASARVTLVAPDGEAMVPLQFKRNSLAVCASIRVVKEVSGTSSTSTRPRTPKQVTELRMEKVIGASSKEVEQHQALETPLSSCLSPRITSILIWPTLVLIGPDAQLPSNLRITQGKCGVLQSTLRLCL
jgi:hypothetical protein